MRSTSGDRLAAGTRVGNYLIERELGGTATGTLYAATHVVLPRRALVKVAALRALSVQMMREACILEALRHAGLPTVYESGMLGPEMEGASGRWRPGDKQPWFALEAVDGERFADALARGPMRPADVAALVRDVAGVLDHAHRRGVVHGGLRPERIVLTGRTRGFPVCVTEWSDARTYDAAMTIPHLPTPGSRTYLAPELVRGDAIDDRADVYALGVVAYQALTGGLPAPDAYIPVRARCPRAPRELAAVIDQMLARDRFDRPSSAEVMGDLAWVTEAPRSGDTLRDLPAVIDVELVALDDGGSAGDAADADLAATATALPRIRKPRWTPASVVTCDHAGTVVGEIDDRDARTRH